MLDVTSLVAAILVVALAGVCHRFGRNAPFLDGVPFPAALHVPFVGAAMQLSTLAGMRRLFLDAANDNGVVSYRIMAQPSVAVTRADHVRQVVNASSYRAPVPVIDMHIARLVGKRSLVLLMRDEWKLHRRLVSRAFQWQNLAAMAPAMASIAETFTNVWRDAATPSIDVFPLLKRLALDTIGRTGFGYDMGALRDAANPMATALAFLLSETNRRCFDEAHKPLSHLHWAPTPANRRFVKEATLARSILNEIVEARLRALHADTSGATYHDLLQAMIDAASADNSPMDAETFADNVFTFVLAGSDTISTSMAYALYLLATHPDVQATAVAEIDAVVGKTTPITYEAMQRLPYVSAVLTEAMRLFPASPIVVRNLEAPLMLDGHFIPAGTIMTIPIWFVNRSTLNWGDDADEFKPERHLDDASAVTSGI
uniref:aromatase n=1 Tax=Hucho hucho TaxID=62062 RepID=A0A4W5LCF1_9TELE